MPQDSETGESFDSPTDALAAALPEGVDAKAVMDALEKSGYSLEASGSPDVEVSIESGSPEGEDSEEKDETSQFDESGIEEEGAPEMGDGKKLEVSMGMIGGDEPLAKRRSAVADKLMEKFKKPMV